MGKERYSRLFYANQVRIPSLSLKTCALSEDGHSYKDMGMFQEISYVSCQVYSLMTRLLRKFYFLPIFFASVFHRLLYLIIAIYIIRY